MDPIDRNFFCNESDFRERKVPPTPMKNSSKIGSKRPLFGDVFEVDHSFKATFTPDADSKIPTGFFIPESTNSLSLFLSSSGCSALPNLREITNQRDKKAKLASNEVKHPLIAMGTHGKTITINNVAYGIEFLDAGKFHNVYTFKKTRQKLEINGENIPLSEVVLRCVKPDIGPREIERVYKEDIFMADYFQKNGIPIPKIYVRPDTFRDTKIVNNGFWIVEKMAEKVTVFDKEAFEFAKFWLTQSMKEGKEIIPDFYANNLMKDKKGMIKVIDSIKPEDFEFFGDNNLLESIIHWSNDGDKEALELLLKDLPFKKREDLIQRAAEKQKLLQLVEFIT